jgi:thiol-disulfide isomerase/thioredoxin
LFHAVLAGLLAARAVHVGLHFDAYRDAGWAVIDLRDGGWHVGSGIVLAVGFAAWQAWRHARWRKALAGGAALGLVIWSAGQVGLGASAPQSVPELTLVDASSGAPVRLHELARGRPLVLNLWASWCGPCRHEMPVLAAAQRQHADVLFVFANQGESVQTVRRYLEAERLELASVWLDVRSQLGPAVGSRGLPTTVFYDARGRRTDAHVGVLNRASLAAKLDSARAR